MSDREVAKPRAETPLLQRRACTVLHVGIPLIRDMALFELPRCQNKALMTATIAKRPRVNLSPTARAHCHPLVNNEQVLSAERTLPVLSTGLLHVRYLARQSLHGATGGPIALDFNSQFRRTILTLILRRPNVDSPLGRTNVLSAERTLPVLSTRLLHVRYLARQSLHGATGDRMSTRRWDVLISPTAHAHCHPLVNNEQVLSAERTLPVLSTGLLHVRYLARQSLRGAIGCPIVLDFNSQFNRTVLTFVLSRPNVGLSTRHRTY
ncbi:hypothetical protein B0H13DRAFT_1874417 [Mycena leptocephala]|nr:hypothetical protein B0H13DRAFT_1874417 [Mycena leptocephala]